MSGLTAIKVRLQADLYDRLYWRTQATRSSMSAFARAAIAEKLAREAVAAPPLVPENEQVETAE